LRQVNPSQLLDRYDGFLLDAYGVLVNSENTLPGAQRFLDTLRGAGKPFRVISNDGSTTPEAKAEKWSGRGLEVLPEELLTPWSVLASEFSPVCLRDKACLVLGTRLSQEMLRRAGGRLAEDNEELDVFILADEMAPDFMNTCDRAFTKVVQAFDSGRVPELVLANPDLVYPTSGGYGLTAGAIRLMFESGWERLLGQPVRFQAVGKPGPGLFQLGLQSLGLPKEQVVMLGDQWDTDILGAANVGIDSVLLTTGLAKPDSERPEQMVMHGFLPAIPNVTDSALNLL
jgi:glycerol-1-phosphatase